MDALVILRRGVWDAMMEGEVVAWSLVNRSKAIGTFLLAWLACVVGVLWCLAASQEDRRLRLTFESNATG